MTGWLIVNSFIDSSKFTELYDMLLDAAKKSGIRLELKNTVELLSVVGEDLCGGTAPDFVIFWDKEIYLAQRLERAGIRVFNSAAAVEYCDNKILTTLKLSEAGVRIPRTIISPKTFEGTGYLRTDFVKTAAGKLGLPLVIKEAFGSFGQQVYLSESVNDAIERVKSLGYRDFIFQEFIKSSRGRDVRINVVGDRAVCAMLRYNDSDFRSNISNGGSMKSYTPNEKQIELAVKACRALKLDFAGVDVLFGEDDEPIICEVNSNPHFKSTLMCTGINMAEHIIRYIAERTDDRR